MSHIQQHQRSKKCMHSTLPVLTHLFCLLFPPLFCSTFSNYMKISAMLLCTSRLYCSLTLTSCFVDASAAMQVRALKDYCNNYDLTSLNIKAGDIITVHRSDNLSVACLSTEIHQSMKKICDVVNYNLYRCM